MYKFKSHGKSYISSNNLILMGHKEFEVFDLDKGVSLFIDKTPFNNQRRRLSHICVNEKINTVVLISFDSDFAIYKIDFKNKTVEKVMAYNQKKRLYCCDASNVWMDSQYVYAIIDQDKGEIIRRISFDGSFTDLTLNEHHFITNLFSIRNDLFVKTNDYRLFLFDKDGFDSGNPFKPFIPNKPTNSVIGDDYLNPFIIVSYNKGSLDFYRNNESKPFYSIGCPKVPEENYYTNERIEIIDGQPVVAVTHEEVVGKGKYSLPIYKIKIEISYDNVTKTIDVGIGDRINPPSFNNEWISYYSCGKDAMIVVPIK